MKPPLLYLIEVLFCSGTLLLFYRLMLVRRVSFRASRRFLILALVLSALLPALDIPLYPPAEPEAVSDIRRFTTDGVGTGEPWIPARPLPEEGEIRTAAVRHEANRPHRDILPWLYAIVAGLSFVLLAVRLNRIRRLRRHASLTPCAGYTLAEHPDIRTPFSFLRTVYLGPGYEGERRGMVLCHEASHIRHRHSVEILLVEIVRCLFWFNPFVWIAQRWLKEVHEWEADRAVLEAGYDLTRYRIVLFRQLFGYNPDIANGLNHSLTKNRFAMMTQFRQRRHAALRFGAAIPVVAGMMMLCSFTTRDPGSAGGVPDAAADDTPTIEVRLSRDSMWIDGVAGSGDDLLQRISAKRDSLSEEDRRRLTVTIQADNEVQMGRISDIKEQMRDINALCVRYRTDGPSVERMLPPRLGTQPDGSQPRVEIYELHEFVPGDSTHPDTYRLKIAERNYFGVLINARGEILAGTRGNVAACSVEELKVRAREFVVNPSSDRSLSESRPMKIGLPDGHMESYDVSRGIFGIETTRETPYAVYADVQQTLSEVYAGLRSDLSRQWFDKPFDELDDPQRRAVQQAVPVRISEVSRNRTTE